MVGVSCLAGWLAGWLAGVDKATTREGGWEREWVSNNWPTGHLGSSRLMKPSITHTVLHGTKTQVRYCTTSLICTHTNNRERARKRASWKPWDCCVQEWRWSTVVTFQRTTERRKWTSTTVVLIECTWVVSRISNHYDTELVEFNKHIKTFNLSWVSRQAIH